MSFFVCFFPLESHIDFLLFSSMKTWTRNPELYYMM